VQVDSHVRFIEAWDDDLVVQWKSAKNEMTVLTTYLSDLTDSIDPVSHRSKHFTRPIMCASDFEGQGNYKHLRHGQQPEGTPFIRGQPTLQPFWAAGFSFARGHFVIQVPYDEYLPMVFQGEVRARIDDRNARNRRL
jgi:Glycosyltransferase (GlcNAc)